MWVVQGGYCEELAITVVRNTRLVEIVESGKRAVWITIVDNHRKRP